MFLKVAFEPEANIIHISSKLYFAPDHFIEINDHGIYHGSALLVLKQAKALPLARVGSDAWLVRIPDGPALRREQMC